MQDHRRDVVLSLVILAACVAMVLLPTGFESPYRQQVERSLARIDSVDNSGIQQFGIVRAGDQRVMAEIETGPYRGQMATADNRLLGKMETDKIFQAGDRVLLVLNTIQDGQVMSATAYDHWRLPYELLLVAIFALFLVVFAGWSGLRALLSFAFAMLLIWRVLLPGILMQRDPVLLALLVTVVMSAATLYLVAGVTRTAQVALIGAILGIGVTCGLAFLLFPPFKLHGAVQPFSETLLYSGYEKLNLTRLFLAAIILGASGAVIDVSIDVATAMQEVVAKRPDLSRWHLVQSGLAVGRNMTSTMVTTLLMAYASGYMALLMVFMAQGIAPIFLLNTNYVAAEMLKTVIGSFGLVTVAPFTALVGGLVFVSGRHTAQVAIKAAAEAGGEG